MPRRRRSLDNSPADHTPVAQAKTSVRTNVARVWERAVSNMRGTRNQRALRDAELAATRAEWTLDASVVDLALPPDATRASSPGSDSGVYALPSNDARAATAPIDAIRTANEVTLIVYGWSSVEPGTLSWVFPTLRAALAAASAMKNAVRWAILSGKHAPEPESPFDVTAARADGHVLVEGAL
jgi:phage-related tail fiber protein